MSKEHPRPIPTFKFGEIQKKSDPAQGPQKPCKAGIPDPAQTAQFMRKLAQKRKTELAIMASLKVEQLS